ncbi:MAG TPA: TolC family protein [Polyangiaceae bacterium]|nr:TolC family protein [Polyangiaceae bacterium]
MRSNLAANPSAKRLIQRWLDAVGRLAKEKALAKGFLLATCLGLPLVAPATRAFAASPETLEPQLLPLETGGLTADQAAIRAGATSFDTSGRRQAVRAAEAKLEQALAAYFPRVTLTARYTRLSPVTAPAFNVGGRSINIVAPFFDQYLAQANLTIPISDYVLRLSQSYAAASRNRRAAELNLKASRLKVESDARDAYYAWVRAKGQAVVAQRTVLQAKEHLVDATHSFDAGASSKADVLRVESQVASAELVLEQALGLAAITEDRIRTAMHDASPGNYRVGEDLSIEQPPPPDVDDVEALKAEAIDKRLEVRALDETAWSLRSQASATRAGYYPRLDAFGDLIVANPNPRVFPVEDKFTPSWDVGVQLVWTPNELFASRGNAGDLEARAAETDFQKAVLCDSVKLEVMQAFVTFHEAGVAIGTTKRALVAAEEGYRVRRELFKSGRATSVELTDSEVELFRASLDSVNARADYRAARCRLLHVTGRDIVAAEGPK